MLCDFRAPFVDMSYLFKYDRGIPKPIHRHPNIRVHTSSGIPASQYSPLIGYNLILVTYLVPKSRNKIDWETKRNFGPMVNYLQCG